MAHGLIGGHEPYHERLVAERRIPAPESC